MNDTNSQIKTISGCGVVLPGNDIDTDRIIPARYLKCVTFDELGQYLFYDDRFNGDGTKKEHPLNEERFKGASILIVNKNFGCGSSREHAPQSLIRFGIKAILGESFAEIFLGNCTAIGLPVVTAEKTDIENLTLFIKENPSCQIEIDLESAELSYGDFMISIHQSKQSRTAFLQGKWDSTSELLSAKEEIDHVAKNLPYLNEFLVK